MAGGCASAGGVAGCGLLAWAVLVCFQVGGVAGWPWVVGLVVGLCLFVAGCFHLRAFFGALFGGVDSCPQPAQNASTGRLWPFLGYCAGGVAGWLAVALWFVR